MPDTWEAYCLTWRNANRNSLHIVFHYVNLCLHFFLCGAFLLCRQWKFGSFGVILISVETVLTRRYHQEADRGFTQSFDRITIGSVLLIFALWAYSGTEGCDWDLDPGLSYFWPLRAFLLLSICWSLVSVGLGALEIDYRASSDVSQMVDDSMFYTMLHLAIRIAEVTARITFIVSSCLLLRPALQSWLAWPYFFAACLVCVPFFLTVYAHAMVLLCLGKHVERNRFVLLSIACVAFTSLVVNPMFCLKSPRHQKEVARFNMTVCIMRFLQVVTFGFLVVAMREARFPENGCPETVQEVRIVEWWFRSTQLPWQLVASTGLYMSLMYYVCSNYRTFQQPDLGNRATSVSVYRFSLGDEHVLGTEQASKEEGSASQPLLGRVGPSFAAERVESEVATFLVGLCGNSLVPFLAQVNPEEMQDGDAFTWELIGGGSFAMVFKLSSVNQQSRMQSCTLPERLAVKLQAVCEEGSSAAKELEVYETIWKQRNQETRKFGHPFILRLLGHVAKWPKHLALHYVDGGNLTTMQINCDCSVLMVELCDVSLATYIVRHWKPGVTDQDAGASREWLSTARRYAAEMVLALEFLHHVMQIAYRDLKPDNCLLKLDATGTYHTKLGDFGTAKLVGPENMISNSLVGSPPFVAPEMMRVWGDPEFVAAVEQPMALDIFGLGATLFVMLCGVKESYGGNFQNFLKDYTSKRVLPPSSKCPAFEAKLEDLSKATRCPPEAYRIIRECTAALPQNRPIAQDLKDKDFFRTIRTGCFDLPQITWRELLFQGVNADGVGRSQASVC